MFVIYFSHICSGVGLDFTALPVQNVFKLAVRMIRTDRKSKIKQNDAKWTGTLRKSTFSNTARQIVSVPAITIDYPTLKLPIANQTSFYSAFFHFLSTYGRNRLIEGSKIRRDDTKTWGIDVFYST